jgi:Fe2+ transport system protein B
MKRLEEETAEYKNWRQRMNDFIDDHRKDEVAHDQALAEELAQKSKADKVLEEYTAKIKEQAEEFEAKKEAMKAEIEAMDRKTTSIVQDKQTECDNRIADMQKDLDEQKAQMAELLDKYAALDADKEKEYGARLAEARDEKDAWSDKCDHIITMHKRGSIVFVALAVVTCIAMLAIGTLIGSSMNLDFGSNKASEQVVKEFNSRMDKLEKQSEDKSNDESKTETNDSAEAKPENTTDGSQTEQQ